MDDLGRAETIRRLNDEFRQNPVSAHGKLVYTNGVMALPSEEVACVLAAVISFDDFDEANDPWGEHDFGGFDLLGNEFLWKIELYDRRIQYGSPDPTNPEVTTRVLIIMLAEEY